MRANGLGTYMQSTAVEQGDDRYVQSTPVEQANRVQSTPVERQWSSWKERAAPLTTTKALLTGSWLLSPPQPVVEGAQSLSETLSPSSLLPPHSCSSSLRPPPASKAAENQNSWVDSLLTGSKAEASPSTVQLSSPLSPLSSMPSIHFLPPSPHLPEPQEQVSLAEKYPPQPGLIQCTTEAEKHEIERQRLQELGARLIAAEMELERRGTAEVQLQRAHENLEREAALLRTQVVFLARGTAVSRELSTQGCPNGNSSAQDAAVLRAWADWYMRTAPLGMSNPTSPRGDALFADFCPSVPATRVSSLHPSPPLLSHATTGSQHYC